MAAQKEESLEVAIDQLRKRYLLLGYTIQYKAFSNCGRLSGAATRSTCPELISDGILRIDFFGELEPDRKVKRFIVNEIESFEACLWGAEKSAGDMLFKHCILEMKIRNIDRLPFGNAENLRITLKV